MTTAAIAPRIKVPRRAVHGVLLLDKPLGWSSQQALAKVKYLLRAEKGGHTGTLDPLATGVLPLCFGAATKFSQLQLDAPKRYIATLQLGLTTTTGDAEGEVLERRDVDVSDAQLAEVQQRFSGAQTQVPPMYSALKKDGKPLYEYARAGVEVERAPRDIVISALTLHWEPGAVGSQLRLEVSCSKGTYIRTLGEDIGQALGCGGHLVMLRRVGTGHFDIEQTLTLAELEAMTETERHQAIYPVACLLDEFDAIALDTHESGRFLSGMRRRGAWPDAECVAVFGHTPRALLGSAHVKAGELIPTRLLSPVEVAQCLAPFTDFPAPAPQVAAAPVPVLQD